MERRRVFARLGAVMTRPSLYAETVVIVVVRHRRPGRILPRTEFLKQEFLSEKMYYDGHFFVDFGHVSPVRLPTEGRPSSIQSHPAQSNPVQIKPVQYSPILSSPVQTYLI